MAIRASRQQGVSLIELMVALVLGLFLIFGAVTIYNQSRSAYRTTEGVARLQESARLALDVLEADIRMASYWGMNSRPEYIVNRAAPLATLPAAFTADQGLRISQCGSNWAINLDEYIGGSNNSYGLACGAFSGAANGASDVLVIRRGSAEEPTVLDPDRIYLQTSRIQGTMFVPESDCDDPTDPSCIPPAYAPPASRSRELEAHAYYVSTRSTMRTDVPSLRRKRFGDVGADPATGAVIDEEIVPGVEDLQVRFGIDTNGDTNVDQYVNPGAVGANRVISATIWLRMRAEEREIGHIDGNSYQYADMASAFTPSGTGRNYRRIVVSRTVQLRNTRT
jgi:type IV pilus assembly protein PilW